MPSLFLLLPVIVVGWERHSPRDEIRPHFTMEDGAFTIDSRDQKGATGQWQNTFPVKGGAHYEFSAQRKVFNIVNARRQVVERLTWLDSKGGKAVRDDPVFSSYRPGVAPLAEPEFPRARSVDESGWTLVNEVFKAPRSATRVKVELSLRWESSGRVQWKDVSLVPATVPEPRIVRLATIHYRPTAGRANAERQRGRKERRSRGGEEEEGGRERRPPAA